MWVFPFADSAPTVLLNYRTDDVDAEFPRHPPAVRAAFGPEPTGRISASLRPVEAADDSCSIGRAGASGYLAPRAGRALGDAAWCVTLYAGMGASTALAGADLLGTMLDRHPADRPAR